MSPACKAGVLTRLHYRGPNDRPANPRGEAGFSLGVPVSQNWNKPSIGRIANLEYFACRSYTDSAIMAKRVIRPGAMSGVHTKMDQTSLRAVFSLGFAYWRSCRAPNGTRAISSNSAVRAMACGKSDSRLMARNSGRWVSLSREMSSSSCFGRQRRDGNLYRLRLAQRH